MNDPFAARMEVGTWFMHMLNEIDQDYLEDEATIDKLKSMIAQAFAQWRLDTGYDSFGLPVELPVGAEEPARS